MAVFNAVFPVLAGKEGDARKFGEEAVGSHRSYYDSLMDASGTSRVTWTLQETPGGTSLLVWFEADEPGLIFEQVATSTAEDAAWFRGRVMDVAGIDMTQPMPGPLPQVIMEWPG